MKINCFEAKTDPNKTKQVEDTWHDVRQVSKTINRTKKIRNRGENILFLASVVGERNEGRKKMIQGFLLRSSEIRRSEFVKLRVKVYLLVEGYVYVLKSLDFTKNQKEEIGGKSKVQAWEVFLRLPTHAWCSCLINVDIRVLIY